MILPAVKDREKLEIAYPLPLFSDLPAGKSGVS